MHTIKKKKCILPVCTQHTYRSLSNSAGRSNFISFVYFFTCASREKLSFNTLLMYLEVIGKNKSPLPQLTTVFVRLWATEVRSLVNGPKQPFGLLVKRHHHLVKSRQLGGDFSGDVRIRQLLRAHAGILEKKERAETTWILYIRTQKVESANARGVMKAAITSFRFRTF